MEGLCTPESEQSAHLLCPSKTKVIPTVLLTTRKLLNQTSQTNYVICCDGPIENLSK